MWHTDRYEPASDSGCSLNNLLAKQTRGVREPLPAPPREVGVRGDPGTKRTELQPGAGTRRREPAEAEHDARALPRKHQRIVPERVGGRDLHTPQRITKP